MYRTLTAIRRTIAAALAFGQYLARAAVSRTFRLLADLYRAIDSGAAVEIAYVKQDGTASIRVFEPAELVPTSTGAITVRGHDRLRGEDRTFRIDRILNCRPAEVG
ncbi:WYL domain-containing protein [Streptomyces noursei]|uniref:WYL domain-containing protein n=1 Tax=Streptomyces noursei TaxID=1971 RepID=UPI0035D9EB4B